MVIRRIVANGSNSSASSIYTRKSIWSIKAPVVGYKHEFLNYIDIELRLCYPTSPKNARLTTAQVSAERWGFPASGGITDGADVRLVDFEEMAF